MFRPQTLADIMFLAKHEEAKGYKAQMPYKPGAATTSNNTTSPSKLEYKPHAANVSVSNKFTGKESQRTKSTLSFKEIMERRERGQCFHCDDPYHPGQSYMAKLYTLLGEEPDKIRGPDIDEVVREMEQLLTAEESPGDISVNALSGNKAIGTIRLQGMIKGKRVSILIDSGSTHSFIDSGVVKQLGLVAEVVSPLIVSVADGSRIVVDSFCKDLQFTIQTHKFPNDLRLFPLGGF